VMIDLSLERKGKRTPLRFAYARMVNAGYTGRNQAEVRRHIEELAKKGIPGPPTTPTLYPVFAAPWSRTRRLRSTAAKLAEKPSMCS